MSLRTGNGIRIIGLALAAVTVAACGSGTQPGAVTARATGTQAVPGQAPAGQAASPAGGPGAQVPGAPGGSCGTSGVPVSTAVGLRAALAAARPGETILLAPGTYRGTFTAAVSGTASAPITLCGPRSAVLDGGNIDSGYTFHLNHASYWRVQDFTVEGGQKGVVTDGADHDLLYGLYVNGVGDEAIHLRDNSSYDIVSHNVVRDTGLLTAFYGEGIYVGSAHENWCRYSGCRPDASDYDVITGNDISNTTAENVDIKEGTTGGTITGNHFDGAGMVPSAATSWVNVKGNNWTVTGNTGTDSIGNGLSVHMVYAGWGYGNVFRANRLAVDGPGYGIYVQSRHLNTVVSCDNTATGAQRGLSNVPCSPA
jgi:hypothetical protein